MAVKEKSNLNNVAEWVGNSPKIIKNPIPRLQTLSLRAKALRPLHIVACERY